MYVCVFHFLAFNELLQLSTYRSFFNYENDRRSCSSKTRADRKSIRRGYVISVAFLFSIVCFVINTKRNLLFLIMC